jgi:RNA recognition motif-containing protein
MGMGMGAGMGYAPAAPMPYAPMLAGRPGDQKIFIAGVPPSASEETLRSALAVFGEMAEVKIVTDKDTQERKGYAFVTFTDSAAAARAAQCTVLFIDGKRCPTNLASAKSKKPQ